jgi:hypothetical protein
MNEKEMGDALLKFGSVGTIDTKLLTQRVLDRDHRRVRLLLGVTIFIWLIAGTLVLAGLVDYGFIFPQQAKLLQQIEAGSITPAQRDRTQVAILVGFQKGSLLVTFGVAKMCFAALCTVILVVVSRRATLRQVNAGLVEVTEQLRLLSPASGSRDNR